MTIEPNIILLICVFAAVSSLILLVGTLWRSPGAAVEARLESVTRPRAAVAHPSAQRPSAVSRIGSALMPEDQTKLSGLQARMRQAGLYQRHSTAIYLGMRALLLATPVLVGVALASSGMLSMPQGLTYGALVGLLGNALPVIWLAHLKRHRQKLIRRSVPDALDVIVICLEGGLSLPASFARVAQELKQAHPLLASEMEIVQREIQMGRTTGEALREFADRFDAEELRSLSAVVVQAERFGASVVDALRVHADDLRLRRHQHAEAEAQKAPVKLVFPTVLFLFPALYIVLMGPAGVQLIEMFRQLGH